MRSREGKEFVTGKAGIAVEAEKALAYLDAKADFVVAGIRDPLTLKTKAILLNAIKVGEPVNVTAKKLQDAYRPYLEDGNVIIDEKQLKGYRLEAIVRTNIE